MTTGPAVTPNTWPVVAFTVAIAGVPLVHVPPGAPFVLRNILEFMHTVVGPLIVPGFGAVVTEIVYDLVDVPQPFCTE
jgi:hypothetical protein